MGRPIALCIMNIVCADKALIRSIDTNIELQGPSTCTRKLVSSALAARPTFVAL